MSTKFDLYELQFATSCAQEVRDRIIADAENITRDPNRDQRLEKHLCPICFYHPQLSVGINEYTCLVCGTKGHYQKWIVPPKLCHECAGKIGACFQCGADLHLKERRKLERTKA